MSQQSPDNSTPTNAPVDAQPTLTSPPHRGVLYPNCYTWYVFLSALDIMLTYLILHPLFSSPGTAFDATNPYGVYEQRGHEVNVLADWVIKLAGVPGMVVYKFALVALVIGICEIVGRRRFQIGLRVAEWAIALSCIPVIIALAQMGTDVWSWWRAAP